MVAVRHLAVVVEGRRRRHGGEGRVTGSQSASGLLILHERGAKHMVMVSFVILCEHLINSVTEYNRMSDEVSNNFSLTVVLRCRDHGFISLARSSSPPTLLFPLPFFHNTRGTDALGQ